MAAQSGIEAIDNDQNVMRLHAAFFDRNNDGVVYPWETYQGMRAIGGGFLLSIASALFINIGFSRLTRPGKWFPNLLFPLELENITLAKHGSDSDTYDTSGRFVSSKFEEIFSKYARTNPDYLTKDELNEFIKGNHEPKDNFGRIAGFVEWNTLYILGKDKDGLLQKETIRGVFDGSLFVKLEEKNNLSKKKHIANTESS
ncbi:caleosin-related, EF-hand domain pair [Artemisia annua]|uniref:Caleosin-related, EF-hand domain pair n=1 Tax=Artemisia annua TaxID=35608 RepID=A0A2U1KIZ8_ARTAN|nr:caleosin-related, EF-hand domain pair [Artemisia annua]